MKPVNFEKEIIKNQTIKKIDFQKARQKLLNKYFLIRKRALGAYLIRYNLDHREKI